MNQVTILDTAIDNLSMTELLTQLNQTGGFVVTPNIDHLMKLKTDPGLRQAYQVADYCVCDSKVLQYSAQFLGTPIREKISGSDLFPAFYEFNKDNEDIKIFLLGAAEGVAAEAQAKINQKVGRPIVVEVYSPPLGFEKDPMECQKIIDHIQASGATVLAVGLGAPKQEIWIAQYREQLPNIKIFLAIGATIDFEAGHKPRSPQWMSNLGIEWLHRLLSEPRRLWKRYLVDSLPFVFLLLKQKWEMIRLSVFHASESNRQT